MASSTISNDPDLLWENFQTYFSEQRWRSATELLKEVDSVLSILGRHDVTRIAEAVKVMADAAGANPELRHRYYNLGVLNCIVKRTFIAKSTPSDQLTTQYLRLLGNSLDEESGECRKCILPYMHHIAGLFEWPSLAPVAIGILLNLCAESGQECAEAVKLSIDTRVAQGLHDGTFEMDSPGAERALAFLNNIASDLPQNIAVESPLATLKEVLKATKTLPEDAYITYAQLVTIILRYLETDIVKSSIAKRSDIFFACLNLLSTNVRRAHALLNLDEHERTESVSEIREELFDLDESDGSSTLNVDQKLVHQLLGTDELGTSLVLLSQQEEYQNIAGVDLIPELTHMMKIIQPEHPSPSGNDISCVCLMLGNMASNPQISEIAVVDLKMHRGILNWMQPAADRNVLRTSAQCLFRLGVREPNRALLGQDGALEACVGLLSLEDPRISPEAASVLKVLLTDTSTNTERFLSSMNLDTDNHLSNWNLNQETKYSRLHQSLVFYSRNTELGDIAIAIVEVVKTICRDPVRPTEALLKKFVSHDKALKPLFKLLKDGHTSYPCQRGLFALGLLSQSKAGASAICIHMNDDDTAMESLKGLVTTVKETATDESNANDTQKTRAALKDNIRVLLHGTRENGAQVMSEQTRQSIDDCWDNF